MELRISSEAPIGEHCRRYNQSVVLKIAAIVLDEQHMESG